MVERVVISKCSRDPIPLVETVGVTEILPESSHRPNYKPVNSKCQPFF